MITYQQAVLLRRGEILHHVGLKNADGTPARFRVNGACKTWKTRPGQFRVPLKRGMYQHAYLTEHNGDGFVLATFAALAEEPLTWTSVDTSVEDGQCVS